MNQFSFEKSSPLSTSGALGNTGLGKSGKGGIAANYQKEGRDSVLQMDYLISRIMLDIEKNTIEYYEKMTHFFQESIEDEGRHSFREDLLKFIQTEYRFQEMSIIDQENKDFVESILVCYRNMQKTIKTRLKTTSSEIDYLNLFSNLMQIKETLIKIYQDLGNYTYPLQSQDITPKLTKYIKFLQEQKSQQYQEYQGLHLYYNFLVLESKALLNLTNALLEQEHFYQVYYEEKMLFQLQKLKQSIVDWIQLFLKQECDYQKFKQIMFLQNFHLLLKCKLDFYNKDSKKFSFQCPFSQVVQTNNGLNYFLNSNNNTQIQIHSNSFQIQNQQQQTQFQKHYTFQANSNPQNNKSTSNKLDQYLVDKQIFEKLINKLHELYPQTCILILQKVTSEKYKQKMESKKLENQLMNKPTEQIQDKKGHRDEMYEDYRIMYKKCSLKDNEFKDHMKTIMEYFTLQIGLIDNYIECSKYHFKEQQQFLYYKLDEQYYLLLEVYRMDKKLINSIVDYISNLCELLRNKNCIITSKDKSKPFKSFVDFIKDKLDGTSNASNTPTIGSSQSLKSSKISNK